MVDGGDYNYLGRWKWYAAKSKNGCWYAQRGINRKGKVEIIKMHRLIMGLERGDGILCDHRDHNGLNNRRDNLRTCTNKQNNQNARPRKNGHSQYKGVSWVNRDKRWLATITVDRKQVCIGRFHSEIKAAKCYDHRAKELFGEFACLNFPENKEENRFYIKTRIVEQGCQKVSSQTK